MSSSNDDSPMLSRPSSNAPMLGGEDWRLRCDWCNCRLLKSTIYFGSIDSVWGLCPKCLGKVEWLDKMRLKSYYQIRSSSTIFPVSVNPHARYAIQNARRGGYLMRALLRATQDNTTILRAITELNIHDPREDSQP